MSIDAVSSTASKRSRTAAQLSFASAAAFVILLALLHVLRPDLDPSWRFISEYEIGRYGWLMRAAFFCLSLSVLALCFAIAVDARGVSGRLGLALLLLAAFGMGLAGVFAPDPVNKLHEVGAVLDHLPFAALLVSWSLSRNPNWLPARRTLRWTAALPLLGLVIFVVSMGVMLPRNGGRPGPDVLVGWPNRIMILAHCLWLMPVARWAAALPRGPASKVAEEP